MIINKSTLDEYLHHFKIILQLIKEALIQILVY